MSSLEPAQSELPLQISAPDARSMAAVDDIMLIDIRTPMEWSRSGLPEGAVALSIQQQDFPQALLDLVEGDRSRPIALICATGNRSAMLQRYLQGQGYRQVSDVSEGMMGNHAAPGWLRRGLPVKPYPG